ncbi:hypothetical protein KI809_05330 [Geobacter pelophilus]|uniref:Uncharacterized protein n=1 Tax=Geoanaerobacter pelophilus TaxID=60036 RepID=A0AAW4L1Q0_9BACT|nr:hypothetical protein [Geoanaerobacter pelophilus]MBT0663720.1 hypothetical protein [Geoanaerobacter pelophilus]
MLPARNSLMALMFLLMILPAGHCAEAILGVKDTTASSPKDGSPAERAARTTKDHEIKSKVIDITYASLVAAANSNRLVPGQRYRIINFRTVHLIADTTEYHRGPIEPLIVTASTINHLYYEALSESYPHDIIHYSIDNIPDLYGSETGHIFYREDPDLDIWAHQDWRNWVSRWWETTEGSGVFDSPIGGFAYQDFPMFNPDWLVRGGYNHIHIGDQNWAGDGTSKMTTKVVFRGKAMKVTMGGGTDPWIFLSPAEVTNITIKDCSDGVVYAGMDNVTFGQNCYGNKFHGNVRDVTFGDGCRDNNFMKDLSSSMIGSGSMGNTFEGNVNGCFIMPGLSNQIYQGDKVGQIIMLSLPGVSSTFD